MERARDLERARAHIAHRLLGEPTPVVIGGITLHPHQQRAAHRLRMLLRAHGGAMLADATGLGKTYVALAVAAGIDQTLIIAPAALADVWSRSMERSGVRAHFVSMERLSRGVPPPLEPALLIIDEAHHLRNPRTKRYDAVARLCDRAQVLLLTATPLQNGRDDLVAQLALFLGDAAYAATDAELTGHIVRRSAAESTLALPELVGPTRIPLSIEDDLLNEIASLPPPLPGSDEGDAGALVTYTLLRQWASSRAAFVSALRRRLAKALALTTSLEAGRWPTRLELAAWTHSADSIQLAIPDLLAPAHAERSSNMRDLLRTVRSHEDAIRVLLLRLRLSTNPDPIRAQTLLDLCERHGCERVLAFSQYAETVREYSRLLINIRPGVAELTASGGRVAGGRVSRREVLAQFAAGTGEETTPRSESIQLLVTTDVLSEGLDLQRASVVVHLDLPWNPARLEQRVGRVRRLGSRHDQIFVYVVAPPAASDRILQVESRLRSKLGIAAGIVGLDGVVVEASITHAEAPTLISSRIFGSIECWRSPDVTLDLPGPVPAIAAAAAPNDGLLALIEHDGEPMLLAALDGGEISSEPRIVARAVDLCSNATAVPMASEELEQAFAAVERWIDDRFARRDLMATSIPASRLRRGLGLRITAILSAAPRHRRAALAPLASEARRGLQSPLGAAGERMLALLAGVDHADEGWLRQVAALGTSRSVHRASRDHALQALIVLRNGQV